MLEARKKKRRGIDIHTRTGRRHAVEKRHKGQEEWGLCQGRPRKVVVAVKTLTGRRVVRRGQQGGHLLCSTALTHHHNAVPQIRTHTGTHTQIMHKHVGTHVHTYTRVSHTHTHKQTFAHCKLQSTGRSIRKYMVRSQRENKAKGEREEQASEDR